MTFIGQRRILEELSFLLDDIKKGNKHNVLFRAPSGMGKTNLSMRCARELDYKKCMYYLPEEGKLVPKFSNYVPYHFIDEAHTLLEQEVIYPLMDNIEYSFFIITNESGGLKEPLRNRCIQLIFEPYTDDESLEIARLYLKFNLEEELFRIIARISSNNPRQIKIMSERLTYVFNRRGVPQSSKEFLDILDILNIEREDGLNQLERTYIDFLRTVGGKASLPTLIGGTGYDKTLILFEIEPKLLYKKLIKISSKGRELC
jgi:Holliday junction resolvasome RuvABC ATP-dependent DNA helicase subunit